MECPVGIEVTANRVCVECNENDIHELRRDQLQVCERWCPNDGLVKYEHIILNEYERLE